MSISPSIVGRAVTVFILALLVLPPMADARALPAGAKRLTTREVKQSVTPRKTLTEKAKRMIQSQQKTVAETEKPKTFAESTWTLWFDYPQAWTRTTVPSVGKSKNAIIPAIFSPRDERGQSAYVLVMLLRDTLDPTPKGLLEHAKKLYLSEEIVLSDPKEFSAKKVKGHEASYVGGSQHGRLVVITTENPRYAYAILYQATSKETFDATSGAFAKMLASAILGRQAR
jgi:hypothetical protein